MAVLVLAILMMAMAGRASELWHYPFSFPFFFPVSVSFFFLLTAKATTHKTNPILD
jgi:hypothetical protein